MPEYERGADRLFEAYALGYYYGRVVGNDEAWEADAQRYGWDVSGKERAAFKDGYERGVSDFVDIDGG